MRTRCGRRSIWGLLSLAVALPTSLVFADPAPTGVVAFQWTAPTHTVEGQPLTDPTGYRVHWGDASGQYGEVLDTGMQASCIVTGLARDAVYYFAVTAYATNGVESGFSAELIWAFGDLDVDGLQDAWELAYFGGLQGPGATPDADVDGDGLTNYEEFIAGSDPMDASSNCRLEAGVTNEQPEVRFVALMAEGAGYDPYERIYDLEVLDPAVSSAATWQPVAGCTGVVGAGQTVTHAVAESGIYLARFFRARARLALQK